jgi:hypothetical protein
MSHDATNHTCSSSRWILAFRNGVYMEYSMIEDEQHQLEGPYDFTMPFKYRY